MLVLKLTPSLDCQDAIVFVPVHPQLDGIEAIAPLYSGVEHLTYVGLG